MPSSPVFRVAVTETLGEWIARNFQLSYLGSIMSNLGIEINFGKKRICSDHISSEIGETVGVANGGLPGTALIASQAVVLSPGKLGAKAAAGARVLSVSDCGATQARSYQVLMGHTHPTQSRLIRFLMHLTL